MTRLLLVRHGETEWNREERYQGQTDVALNDMGRAQAAAVGRRLANEPIGVAYASDLQRAWATAGAILQARPADAPQVALHPDERLRELHFGDWEGLTRTEIATRYPEQLAARRANSLRNVVPGAESAQDGAARIGAFLTDITTRHPDENVLVVAHGGVLQLMCCLFLDGNLALRRRFRLANASLSIVHLHEAGASIHLLNDTNHLAGSSLGFP